MISDSGASAVPLELTSFVGRVRELGAVCALIQRQDVRLVTLTGPGGVGKTRLARQVATTFGSTFPDGVRFIPLATVNDPIAILPRIAHALDIAEISGQSLIDRVADALQGRQLLLALDNFEQILDAAPLIGTLLAACPMLRILITSRAPLHISGEHEFPVSPLAIPDSASPLDTNTLMQYPATRLYIERARAVNPDFTVTADTAPDVTGICARLDGLPLAIELAAARMKVLTPSALLARLDHSLTVLTSGMRDAPLRQQTLRATIEWSYSLLGTGEQILFDRMAAFAGGGTLHAIAVICNREGDLPFTVLDGITSLVDKSVVQRSEESGGDSRFGMLETIREYARERLTASNEHAEVRRAHAAYFLALAERLAADLRTPKQQDALVRFDAEYDNFCGALDWALERREAEMALRLGSALGDYWSVRGYWSEGRRWLETALGLSSDVPSSIRARALVAAARLAWLQNDIPTALVSARESLTIMQELGDKAGIAESLRVLGNATHYHDDADTTRGIFEQSLAMARDSGDKQHIAGALNNVANIALEQGDFATARALFGESLAIRQGISDKIGTPVILRNLGTVARRQGDLTTARELYEQSLAISRDIGDEPGVSATLNHLGSLARDRGDYDTARVLLEESLAIRRETGNHIAIAAVLENLGNVARAQGDAASARARFEESLAIGRERGNEWSIAYALSNLGRLALDQRDNSTAHTLCEQGLAMAREFGDERCIAFALSNAAHVAEARGDVDTAYARFRESLLIYRQIGSMLDSIACVEGIAAVIGRRGQGVAAARLWGAVGVLREAIGAPQSPADETRCDDDRVAARSSVTEAEWAAAWAEGRTMTPDQAITAALDAIPPEQIAPTPQSGQAENSAYPAALSVREVEVLRLIAAGHTNRQIAEMLSLSPRTIDVHVRNIFAKTGTENRAGATAFAFRHTLV